MPAPFLECNCFQSHLGSIAAREWRHLLEAGLAFNPTLVRLRPHSPPHDEDRRHNFQSHLGSIAAVDLLISDDEQSYFQSHLGSIAA